MTAKDTEILNKAYDKLFTPLPPALGGSTNPEEENKVEKVKEFLRKQRSHLRELFSAPFYQFSAEPGRAGRKITAMIHKRLLRYFGQFLIIFYCCFDFVRDKHPLRVFRMLYVII